MLHHYSFANFQSYREWTEVSMLVDGKVPQSVWARNVPTGERVSSVMSVIGANASGKTALLKPLLFVDWFISQSFAMDPQAAIPVQPHLSSPNEPSQFEVEADFEGRLWRYSLRCTPERVLHESLYVKHDRMRYVFTRDWNEDDQVYVVKQKDFGLLPAEAKKVRPNASLIATAAQYGVPLAQRLAISTVRTNIHQYGRQPYDPNQLLTAAAHFVQSDTQRLQLVSMLRRWDLGLKDVDIRQMDSVQPDGSKQPFWVPFGIHSTSETAGFELPFMLESNGTQSLFVLLSRLLPALERGGVVVIDELENDLHPHMLEPILELFASSKTNPGGAQLLFTCHAVEVLNVLHKSQVMLVEKDEQNQSTAWRLDSVGGVRNDDNLYAKYMAGAYGAVPQL
ncbi:MULTISPECIES: ATP/GTP-binding protein [Acidovorax]|uniref:ATP/GTP-binding protein n=1 Tax=Acidovorax facilis TaxID=12917 RepID=A0ABV8DK55_9BURK|nr:MULTISPECIES: ATP-binding protein [Acidovorax]KQB57059.1 abortive infection protein [Acidovorax sp. SD340]MBO1009891.1 ATP-binding protein [Acidovorax sp. SD340]MCO4244388.1 ATP-binding protein [Acidovorax facilis]